VPVISEGAYDSPMASLEIPVDLPVEACEVACAPYLKGPRFVRNRGPQSNARQDTPSALSTGS